MLQIKFRLLLLGLGKNFLARKAAEKVGVDAIIDLEHYCPKQAVLATPAVGVALMTASKLRGEIITWTSVVVKVGGSLAMYPESLRALCKKLSALSKKHRLVVVPGGGEFADAVRAVDKRFNLSSEASHRMAILGMDQYGLMLADLIPDSVAVVELEEIAKALDAGKVPVFLPSKILFSEDPLENSWDVTSDSIAIYIAHRLQMRERFCWLQMLTAFLQVTQGKKNGPD